MSVKLIEKERKISLVNKTLCILLKTAPSLKMETDFPTVDPHNQKKMAARTKRNVRERAYSNKRSADNT